MGSGEWGVREMWLGLMVGNSRLHWALFEGQTLCCTWDTPHVSIDVVHKLIQYPTINHFPPEIRPPSLPLPTPHSPLPIYLASVVPKQTEIWQTSPYVRLFTLNDVPLQGMYSSFGIDRALALWGAIANWGLPVLVIDTGTALTFTAADNDNRLLGGAILPGLGLQLATLNQKTGQLPQVKVQQQPTRFALNTEEAIASGVIYTLVAGIKDFIEAWWKDYPESKIVMTGGDRVLLGSYLQLQFPEIAKCVNIEANLIFWGMGQIVET